MNRRLAELLWPGQDAIGRRFKEAGESSPWMEVVGVTTTGKYRLLFEDPQPYFYVPIAQNYTALKYFTCAAASLLSDSPGMWSALFMASSRTFRYTTCRA